MHYQEHGTGEAVVLLHDLLGTGGQWEPQIEALQTRHRVLTPDLRGHGRTPNPEGFQRIPEQLAGDVLAFLDELGVDQAHVIGTGMGAHAALSLGLRAPERALSLVLSGFRYRQTAQARHQLERTLQGYADLRETPPIWQGMEFRHQASDWFELLEGAVTDYLENPVDFPEDALASLDVPVLIVQGDLEDEERRQGCALRDLLPRAKLAVLPYAGSPVHLEQPDLYSRLVLDFLNRLDTVL